MVFQWRPAQIGVEQNSSGIDHRCQQGALERLGPSGRRLDVAGLDRGASDVDQDRVWQAAGYQRSGERVDRRRSTTFDRCAHSNEARGSVA
jgi:hypothetical protein